MTLGDVVLFAILVGAGIGMAQTSTTKTVTQIIMEVRDESKKRLYIMWGSIGAAVISICLSLIRYWLIHTGSGASVPFIVLNPFTFALINLLFIAAIAFLVYFHFPSKAQVQEMHRAVELDSEIQKSNASQSAYRQELEKLRKEREFLIELRTKLMHAEQKLHELIGTFFDEAIGHFKHENTLKRTDGIFPDCFKQPHKSLSDEDSDYSGVISN